MAYECCEQAEPRKELLESEKMGVERDESDSSSLLATVTLKATPAYARII
jgi:hypothetical protein